MNQQLNQRPEPLAFRVLISKTKELNIILSNKKIENERTYSHFVTLEQAEQFAADLETTLSTGHYTCLDRCFLCGKPFIRTDDVCMLTNDREAHWKCFYTAIKKKQLTAGDRREGYTIYFPSPEMPEYDFSNLDDEEREFRYAVQIVSQKVIHLWVQEERNRPKQHFCLTFDDCLCMIQEIRRKAYMVRKADLGTCICCEKTVYVNDDRFTMASGELVHSGCMERLVTGELATKVSFPATRTRLYDEFGFVKRHDIDACDLYPFPVD